MPDVVPIRRALISLSDKAGLEDLAAGLARHDVELVSTGGTAARIHELGHEVREISEITGFPEMMDGRVKTLHPNVHGGLLGVRGNAGHEAAMAEHGITPIDLVVVNLYPFQQTVARGAERDEVIENIDIGGPSMLRSAAVMARWYISCMLSLPLDGELENICARCDPTGASRGKYRSPCSTLPVTFSQLSRNVACICATAGPRTR